MFSNLEDMDSIFNSQYFMIYGKNLKELLIYKPKIQLIYVIETISIYHDKNNFMKLYNNDEIERIDKKFIFNRVIGNLGKIYNTKCSNQTFLNKDDALEFIQNYNLKGGLYEMEHENLTYYMYKTRKRVKLINGFLPIRFLILDNVRISLFKTVNVLKSIGCEALAIKTDAIFYENAKNIILENNEYFNNKIDKSLINGYKFEFDKILPLNNTKYHYDEQIEINDYLRNYQIKQILINDEYDTNEIISKTIDLFTLLIIGCAGSGKSNSADKIVINNYKIEEILCITAWNYQAIRFEKDYQIKGITFHTLLGLNFNDDYNNENRKSYDLTNIKCIIIDEIYLFTLKQLIKLSVFINNNKNIKFIGTGDDKQLEAVCDNIDNETKTYYLKMNF